MTDLNTTQHVVDFQTNYGPNVEPMADIDFDSLRQDVNDPIWPSEPVNPDVGPAREQDGIRTLHGALDLLQHVEEDLLSWIENSTEVGPGHRPPRKRDKPHIIDTVARAAKSWRGVTWNVGTSLSGGIKIVEERDDRIRVVITNWGPGILYLSHESGSGTAEPQINTIQIPPPGTGAAGSILSNFRELRSKGEIWAFPATPGTPQTVDVQDEYGLPE